MKGDFTRSTFRPAKHYSSVRMQQGRVQLDADWNEQNDIEAYLDQTTRYDVIGPCGVPKIGGGFAVGLAPSGVDLTLSAGRIYVDGILCELDATPIPIQSFLANNRVRVATWFVDERAFQANQWVELTADGVAAKLTRVNTVDPAQRTLTFADNVPQFNVASARLRRVVTYTTQPDVPGPITLTPADTRVDLIYLDVWQRHITAIEDGGIREVALGGPDTATRFKTVWQVRVLPNVGDVNCQTAIALPPASDGRLSSDVIAAQPSQDPCIVPPGGGYRGLENHLYRVEIHNGGAPYVWPRPAGVNTTAVESITGTDKVKVTNWVVDGRAWQVGQVVEVFSTQSDATNQAGTLARITAVDEAQRTLTVDADVSGLAANTNRTLRRIATFKWSRDNGSVVFGIDEFNPTDGTKVKLKRLGRDSVLGLHVGDWVEVLGDATELSGVPGGLAQILPNGIDEEAQVVTLNADVSAYASSGAPKLRRWDQKSDAIPVTPGTIDLEEGIQISFSGGRFTSGDYWSFDARTATADIERLIDAPPQGIQHHYCRLALVTWQQVGETWQADIQDCRIDFPSLTAICAEDVCFDNSQCQLPDAETVQDALDLLCQERDLRFHNKHLHGWGIVCGLQVTCGPDDDDVRRNVTVHSGYAIDCEGTDIQVERDEPVSLLARVLEFDKANPANPILDAKGDGEACLTLELDEQHHSRYGLKKYDPSTNTWQSLLSGTLLMNFYNDCIDNIRKFFEEELQPPKGEEDAPASPVYQRLSALANLVVQPINPQTGQNVFLSPREDKILREFYAKLRDLLKSETFCAMFENARPFPDYPFGKLGMDTVFGRSQHTRIRLRPDGLEGYTVGSGLNPLSPSTTINRYDLRQNVLIERINPIAGAESDKSKSDTGAGSVQDVAFSADGRRIFMIASTKDEENTFFRVGTFVGKGINWGPLVTICGVKLVTLATTAADRTRLYAIGLKKVSVTKPDGKTATEFRGAGLYVIDPDNVNPNMDPLVPFNAFGHLVITPSGRACATFQSQDKQPDTYDRVKYLQLPAGTLLRDVTLAMAGRDDIAVRSLATGAPTDTLFAVLGPSEGHRLVFTYNLNSGQSSAEPVILPDTAVRLEPYAPTNVLLVTLEDNYSMRLIDMNTSKAVDGYLLPMQVNPIAVAAHAETKHAYVLNHLSNTITTAPGAMLDPKFRFDLKTLAAYRKGVLEAFADLLGGFLQYLKDCLCHHFLVDCPDCSGDTTIYLACVSIRGNQVYKVCNFSMRRYVKSFPTVGYWLSLMPIIPIIDRLIEQFCCIVLPDLFGKYVVPDYDEQASFTGESRVKAGRARPVFSGLQGLNIVDGIRGLTQRFGSARETANVSFAPSNVYAPSTVTAFRGGNVINQSADSAEAEIKASGAGVKRVAYDQSSAPGVVAHFTSAFRQPGPGKEVTLYEEQGVVKAYTVADVAPPTELHAQVSALNTSLAETRQALAQKDAQLVTLSAQIRNLEERRVDSPAGVESTKVAELEARLAALDLSLRNLTAREARYPRVGPNEWLVFGRVLDAQGQPFTGATVRVFDRDRKYDDLLGETQVDERGDFNVVYHDRDFAEVRENLPELYVMVADATGKALYTSRNSVRFKAGRSEYFDITLEE